MSRYKQGKGGERKKYPERKEQYFTFRQVRLKFLEAIVTGQQDKAGVTEGGDAAAAARVLQSAQGIAEQLKRHRDRQLLAAEKASATGDKVRPTASLEESDEEVGGGSELEEEEGEEQAGGPVARRQLPMGLSAAKGWDFNSEWMSQSLKEGLVGALVALAFPDRIARWAVREGLQSSVILQLSPLKNEGGGHCKSSSSSISTSS